MHILFLTDNFPPEVNAPASRTFEHAREWVRAGHQVTVVTGVPNFPTGRVFPGYRNRLWQQEWMEGVRVIRVWTFVAANRGRIRRTLDYLSFGLMAVLGGLCVRRPDVVVGTSPQIFTVCAAWLVSRVKQRPFVFELRDLWPASIQAVGAVRRSTLLKAVDAVVRFLYRQAALVVCVTESFRTELLALGVNRSRIVVVRNGADGTRFFPRPKDRELLHRLGFDGYLVVGYIGTIGMVHGLQTVLEAARELQREPVRFLLVGDGAERVALERLAQQWSLTNVRFAGLVSKDDVVRYWSVLDLALIPLRKTPVFRTVLPSKLFESLAMGVPVLLGVEGEAARLVAETGVGLCLEPEHVPALVSAIRHLRSSPGELQAMQRRCVAVAAQHSRTRRAQEMLKVLEHVVTGMTSQVELAPPAPVHAEFGLCAPEPSPSCGTGAAVDVMGEQATTRHPEAGRL
ncbi:MAG TPA: glycosyltransferase family 4 protein [Nitrospiraceae bacterium]|nr:glycosyltransferase family 4 protein [Nitrospiraceae bacterium]